MQGRADNTFMPTDCAIGIMARTPYQRPALESWDNGSSESAFAPHETAKEAISANSRQRVEGPCKAIVKREAQLLGDLHIWALK